MRSILHPVVFLTLLFLCVPFSSASAQEGSGGLLSNPGRSGDIFSLPPAASPSPSSAPSPASAPTPSAPRADQLPDDRSGSGSDSSSGAQLNIAPMRLEENKRPAADSAAVLSQPPPRDILGDMNLESEVVQENEMWWMDEIFEKLPRGIREDLLERSAASQLSCEQSYMMNNFYDCECYGLAVLKELVVNGEIKSVAFSKADERFSSCVDTAKVSGFAYNRCQSALLLGQISDEMLENVCVCTALGFAKDYERNPIANMDRADRMYNTRLLNCRRNPALMQPRKNTP